MLRIFKAFLWLRWRVLMNSLERTGARDTLERFSVATEKLGPIITLILFVPSSLGLFVLGLFGGFGLGTGVWSIPFEVARYFLLLATAFTIFGPIMLPTRDGGNAVRFLLLPIPRLMLYASQVAGALADPWILLTVPVLVGVPLGAAIAGHAILAALSLASGLGLLLLITGLTSLTSTVIHLLLRNRRRGDLVMLVVVLVLPLIGLLPSILDRDRALHRRDGRTARQTRAASEPPSTFQIVVRRGFAIMPSELYHRSAVEAAGAPASALVPLAGLAATAFAIQVVGFAAFKRLLDMPMSLGARRAGAFGGLWGRTIPGLSPGASAVAFTQLRLAMRTPRGRSILAGPLLIFAAFTVMIYRSGGMPFAGVTLDSGLSLATFGCFVCLFSILPLAMNQFAIDKAGFTRQMLSPLTIGELLAGKAVGNALIVAGPAICCLFIPAVIFPGGHPALWLALLLSMIATYMMVAPVAAALSAVFPRTVDLSSIGHASNAHQGAALLGLLSFVASAAPSAALVLVATRLLHRPELAPVFVLVWCATAFGISWLLFGQVRRLVTSRCETLAQHY
jgi:hypothetical protein